MSAINANHVRGIFGRWERLEDEKRETSDSLKDLFAEAKGLGFNTKAMRAAFRMKRKRDDKPEEFASQQGEVELYLAALGMEIAHARNAREMAETGEQLGKRDGDKKRSARVKGNTGGSDREDRIVIGGSGKERPEPQGHRDPHPGGDEASETGHRDSPVGTAAPEGVVLPIAPTDDIPAFLIRQAAA